MNANTKKFIIIDAQVKDWQSLVAGFGDDAAVLVLDSEADGLMQIRDYLNAIVGSANYFY